MDDSNIEVSVFADVIDFSSPATIHLQQTEGHLSPQVVEREFIQEVEEDSLFDGVKFHSKCNLEQRQLSNGTEYFHILTKRNRGSTIAKRGRGRRRGRGRNPIKRKPPTYIPSKEPKRKRGRPRGSGKAKVKKDSLAAPPGLSNPPPLMVNERQKRKPSSRFATYLEVLKGEREFFIDTHGEEAPKPPRKRRNSPPLPAPDVSLVEGSLDELTDKMCVIHVRENEDESDSTCLLQASIQDFVQEILGLPNSEEDEFISSIPDFSEGNYLLNEMNIDSKKEAEFKDFLLAEPSIVKESENLFFHDGGNFDVNKTYELAEIVEADDLQLPTSDEHPLEPVSNFILSKDENEVFDNIASSIDIESESLTKSDEQFLEGNILTDVTETSEDRIEHTIQATDDAEKYRCKVCSMAFDSLSSAREHAKEFHGSRVNNIPTFKCSICDREFPTERGRNRHHLLAHRSKPSQCKFCSMPFKGFRTLERHLRDIHDMNPSKFCKFCEEEFVLGTSLEHHMEIMHPLWRSRKSNPTVKKKKELHQCLICKKTFFGIKTLRAHHQKDHNGQAFACSQCTFKTISMTAFKKHLAKFHNSTNYLFYNCGDCNAEYHNAPDLEEHCVSVHEKPLVNQCSFCGESFATVDMWRFHRSKHKPYTCERCHSGFAKQEAWQEHMKNVHSKDTMNFDSINLNDNLFQVGMNAADGKTQETDSSISTKVLEINNDGSVHVNGSDEPSTSFTKSNMIFHLLSNKEGGLEQVDAMSGMKAKAKDLPAKSNCPICGKLLTTSFLRVHMLSHNGKLPHKCHMCPKAYAQTTLLRKHMKNRHYEEFLKLGNKRPKKKKVKCTFCEETFDDIYPLEEHLWKHMDTKEHVCDMCGIKFGMEENYKEHFKGHYFKERVTCPICGRVFKSIGFYTEHVERCQSNWECEVCGLKCESAGFYRSHKKTEHEGDLYQCEFCIKSFSIKYRYDDHILAHSSEKNFHCKICGKSFKRQRPLNNHIARCHSIQAISCKKCDATFESLALLESHKKSHQERHECTICKFVYLCPHALQNHLAVHHVDPNGKKFDCGFCGKFFDVQINMKNHFKEHVPDSPHPCQVDKCQKLFKRENVLRSHMTRVHSYIDYYCYVCGKRFVLDSELQRHFVTEHESDNSPLKCDKCNFSCKTTAQLNKHLARHSDSQPFECLICGEKAIMKPHILKHVQTKHDVHNPADFIQLHKWQCSFCTKSFISYNSLIKHLEMHAIHGVKAEGMVLSLRLSEVANDTPEEASHFQIDWEGLSSLLTVQVISNTQNKETGETVNIVSSTWQCPSCYYMATNEEDMKTHFLTSSQCQETLVYPFLENLKKNLPSNIEGELVSSAESQSPLLLVKEPLPMAAEEVKEKEERPSQEEQSFLLLNNGVQFMPCSLPLSSPIEAESLSVPFLAVDSLSQSEGNLEDMEQSIPVSSLLNETLELPAENSSSVFIKMEDGRILIPGDVSNFVQCQFVKEQIGDLPLPHDE